MDTKKSCAKQVRTYATLPTVIAKKENATARWETVACASSSAPESWAYVGIRLVGWLFHLPRLIGAEEPRTSLSCH